MKSVRTIVATLVFACAFNFAANAQTNDDENTVAFASPLESLDVEDAEEVMGVLNVYPKEAALKVMVDVEDTQNIAIYNIAGIKVKEMEVSKGQSINIETLIPGEYTIVSDERKKGSFIKK